MTQNIYSKITLEQRQGADTRRPLIKKVEKALGQRTLVTFFTSFTYPTSIQNDDCDLLQSVLEATDLSNGLALMISSPGGDGLAAERIVNTCRAYSGTGDFWAIVPARAKSAATIICMGAARIYMTASSELGPVDPQIIGLESGVRRQWSAVDLVRGYEELFKEATNTKGKIEPYLQQLQKYDHRDIQKYKRTITLAEDIAVKVLRSGVMTGVSDADIRKNIEVFTSPQAGTFSHGRAIFLKEAKDCGLKIEEVDVDSALWEAVYELYARTDVFVSRNASKAIESKQEFFVPAPSRDK